jgi:hypothetical protein
VDSVLTPAFVRELLEPHLGPHASVDPSLSALTALSQALCELVWAALPARVRQRAQAEGTSQAVQERIGELVSEELEAKLRGQDEAAQRAFQQGRGSGSAAQSQPGNAASTPAASTSSSAPVAATPAPQNQGFSASTPAPAYSLGTPASPAAPSLTPGLLAAAASRLSAAQVASVAACLGGSVPLAFEHLIGRTYFACTRNRARVEQWLMRQKSDCTIVRLGSAPGTLSLSFVVSLHVQHIRLGFDPVSNYFTLQGTHQTTDPRTGRTVDVDLSMHHFRSIPNIVTDGQHVYAFPPLWTPALAQHPPPHVPSVAELKQMKPIVLQATKR